MKIPTLTMVCQCEEEAGWPSGQCAGVRVEKSGFETWQGQCVVF